MNHHTLTFARILFQNKALRSNGQEYENLFISVMTEVSPNFQPVKPQGKKGDGKNDGFDFLTGEYYQCYAPEDLLKKISTAVDKLQKSADGLVGYWDNISKVKKIYFVVNDKYLGAYAEIHLKLAELRVKYLGIEFELFRTKTLEDYFLSLSLSNIQSIIGYLPDSQTIELEFDYFTEVLNHLMSFESNLRRQNNNLPDQLDFIRKIKHNELSDDIGSFLQTAHYSIYKVIDYFKYNSDFAKDELQKIFVTLYKEETSKIDDSNDKSNTIFNNLFEKIIPRNHQNVEFAVLILMAYYFEACDIFEEPQ